MCTAGMGGVVHMGRPRTQGLSAPAGALKQPPASTALCPQARPSTHHLALQSINTHTHRQTSPSAIPHSLLQDDDAGRRGELATLLGLNEEEVTAAEAGHMSSSSATKAAIRDDEDAFF